MTTIAIIQARAGSTRLPGKIFLDIGGSPVLAHVVNRAKRIEGVDLVAIATSTADQDNAVADFADSHGFEVFRGSEQDVLSRYSAAATYFGATTVLRITGDCPLIDPAICSKVLTRFNTGRFDYVSNIKPPTYPDGLDTEVFSYQALIRADGEAHLPSHREHVTPYFFKNPDMFSLANVEHTSNLSHLSWTLDDADDLAVMHELSKALGNRFGTADLEAILAVVRDHPAISALNADKVRNEFMERQFDDEAAALQRENH